MELKGLVVDWGGVLTRDVRGAFGAWAEGDGFDPSLLRPILGRWLGPGAVLEAETNPVHALERGEMEIDDFEGRLASELSKLSGVEIQATGLMQRLFAGFEAAHDMNALVRRARRLGIKTALLSNSWGNDYPADLFDGMFDVIVISGEVGMRKPEERIYLHTLELLGLDAAEAVFVDDLHHNVEAAVSIGMVGIHHVSYEKTAAELDILFGVTVS